MSRLAVLLRSRTALWWVGVGATVAATAVLAVTVDRSALAGAWAALRRAPLALTAVLVAYAAAFALRAWAWRRTLPALPFGHALAALHVSTGANHVLPLRIGEVLRVTSVVRRTGVGLAAATASTVSLRAADLLALGSLAAVLGPGLFVDVVGRWGPALLVVAALATVLGGTWLSRLRRVGERVRVPGPLTLAAVVLSWMLEAAVVHQAAAWAGLPLDLHAAVLVTAVTIAAQTAAIAPGGLGTYEAAATAVLVALGADAGTALAVALTAHAVKTAYALV
ncbi:MAG TPA: lysylphosphatidylglycerol synthase domain-containing protein, partial [Egibacteraceae bacterium]